MTAVWTNQTRDVSDSFLLTELGASSYLLLETGDQIILEQSDRLDGDWDNQIKS